MAKAFVMTSHGKRAYLSANAETAAKGEVYDSPNEDPTDDESGPFAKTGRLIAMISGDALPSKAPMKGEKVECFANTLTHNRDVVNGVGNSANTVRGNYLVTTCSLAEDLSPNADWCKNLVTGCCLVKGLSPNTDWYNCLVIPCCLVESDSSNADCRDYLVTTSSLVKGLSSNADCCRHLVTTSPSVEVFSFIADAFSKLVVPSHGTEGYSTNAVDTLTDAAVCSCAVHSSTAPIVNPHDLTVSSHRADLFSTNAVNDSYDAVQWLDNANGERD